MYAYRGSIRETQLVTYAGVSLHSYPSNAHYIQVGIVFNSYKDL